MLFRSKGLNFGRRRRKKINPAAVKNVALWVFEIVVVLFVAYLIVYFAGMKVTMTGNSMKGTLASGDRVLVDRLVYDFSSPKPGDLVVFLPNGNTKSHYYIKRVIGVPGDTVQIKDGAIYVNGEESEDEGTKVIKNAGLAEEPVKLGTDEYFVMGDNSDSSEDSRYTNVGNVKKEYIIGKAWFIVGPFKDIGRIK